MTALHPLLAKQIARARRDGVEMNLDEIWASVSETYREADIDRRRTDHTIRMMMEDLDHRAEHDAMTGLANRARFTAQLQKAIGAGGQTRRVAVLFLDLDRFKSVNYSLGHDVGDALLRSVAERLSAVVRDIDTVCRLGCDEFVIVLSAVAGPDDAVMVSERIVETLARPVELMGHAVRASTSIGISLYPEDGRDAHALMKNADTAMYTAKSRGRNNFQFFSPEMNEVAIRFFRL